MIMYRAIVDSPTSMPSLFSSPWILGAPQSGFSLEILRIRSRVSTEIAGLPCRLDRLFHFQYNRHPLRCQPTTVLGWTMVRCRRQSGRKQESIAQSTRSDGFSRGRLAFRCNTSFPSKELLFGKLAKFGSFAEIKLFYTLSTGPRSDSPVIFLQ